MNQFNNIEKLYQQYPIIPLGKAKDLYGQEFGRLKALERVQYPQATTAYWACACSCGNYSVVRAGHLLQGRIVSCGCSQKDFNPTKYRTYAPNHENLKGKIFGLLKPIEYVGKDKSSHALWKCECECGNTCIVTATHLKTNHTTSCGCTTESQYERRAAKFLNNEKISYSREFKIFELGKLRFDFKINLEDNTFILIEIQGQQHYKPSTKFGGEDYFKKLQLNDLKKQLYCQQNHIYLYTIKYDENIEQRLQMILSNHKVQRLS